MIELGDKIDGRYRISSRIATGGMADVYEANDLVNRRIVSLKIMKEALLRDPENLKRFQRETAMAASLSHPNIVQVYGSGEIEGRPYMANEYVKGQTLRDKLEFSVTLNLADACEVMVQLATGVDYIHKHGLVHRDLKPDNLFYMRDGTLKISDFGISTPVGAMPSGDAIQGTIYYCAPEVLLGKPASVANDIYSMGVVFFEILTGRVPFDGKTPDEVAVKQVEKRFPEASKILPSIPPIFDKIIIQACRKRPEERYPSAEAFRQAIIDAMSDKNNFKERRGLLSLLFGFK
ncbi:MAG: serine/threonine protein kinase [Bacilli bacterium]|nr:serine/threonine protein kinase [Bacilli bacterium]